MLRRKILSIFIVALFAVFSTVSCDKKDSKKKDSSAGKAKYVFLFIGDGVGMPQITAAEVYKGAIASSSTIKPTLLNMTQLPAQGFATTYSSNSYITDSAAAGTAIATGKKTESGVISMGEDKTTSYKTIAEMAKDAGMKVGIVSSVSIDHATPATFYSHQKSRNDYEEIGQQLLDSNFDYFAGGGFRVNKYSGYNKTADNTTALMTQLETDAKAKGYSFADTRAEFTALNANSGKVIAVNPYIDSSKAVIYAIDRMRGSHSTSSQSYSDSITLAEFTQKGIDLLDNPKGFFMMVESGKIDWACHANDAATSIQDTIAFDDAIKKALEFYEKHPKETLIIVTGDHECGGMTIGFSGTKYATYFDSLKNQNMSYDEFSAIVDVARDSGTSTWTAMQTSITSAFGLKFTGDPDTDPMVLRADEITDLEIAYNESMAGNNYYKLLEDFSHLDPYQIYGGYEPLSVAITHMLNRKAGIGWTSYSHTGVPVPTFAKGVKEELFNGYYDNTDIYKYMVEAMGF